MTVHSELSGVGLVFSLFCYNFLGLVVTTSFKGIFSTPRAQAGLCLTVTGQGGTLDLLYYSLATRYVVPSATVPRLLLGWNLGYVSENACLNTHIMQDT
jgi:hypothetical protein